MTWPEAFFYSVLAVCVCFVIGCIVIAVVESRKGGNDDD